MRRILSATASIAILLALAGPAQADPGTDTTVSADLEGVPIRTADIPNHYCHDHAFPVIHCFRTAAALEADVAKVPGDAVAAADYAVVYSSQTYAGSYLYISQDYDTLFAVGWNDRIRSFRGVNFGLGTFWTDWYATGARLDFCCNVVTPSLSATFDRAITSVYRR
jgi:hypothetical protein